MDTYYISLESKKRNIIDRADHFADWLSDQDLTRILEIFDKAILRHYKEQHTGKDINDGI